MLEHPWMNVALESKKGSIINKTNLNKYMSIRKEKSTRKIDDDEDL